MPYKRGYKRTKRFRRKPVVQSNTLQRVGNVAWKAFQMAKFLHSIVNSEKHVSDVLNTDALSTTYEAIRLSAVAQSDDLTGRTGRSIMVKSLQIKCNLQQNASATQPSIVRIIIGIDYDANSTIVTNADLLSDTSNPLVSMRNLATDRGRFKILLDKTITIDIDEAGKSAVVFNKFFSLGNHHVFYSGTSGTDESKGKLFWFAVSNQATNTVGKTLTSRIRFYDN